MFPDPGVGSFFLLHACDLSDKNSLSHAGGPMVGCWLSEVIAILWSFVIFKQFPLDSLCLYINMLMLNRKKNKCCILSSFNVSSVSIIDFSPQSSPMLSCSSACNNIHPPTKEWWIVTIPQPSFPTISHTFCHISTLLCRKVKLLVLGSSLPWKSHFPNIGKVFRTL